MTAAINNNTSNAKYAQKQWFGWHIDIVIMNSSTQ